MESTNDEYIYRLKALEEAETNIKELPKDATEQEKAKAVFSHIAAIEDYASFKVGLMQLSKPKYTIIR